MKHLTRSNSSRAHIFLLGSLLLLGLLCVGLMMLLEQQNRRAVSTDARQALTQLLQNEKQTLQQTFTNNMADVRFIAKTPPIKGIIRAKANTDFDQVEQSSLLQWQQRLGQIFQAYLSSNPSIAQIRYIGVAEKGRELVRVERERGNGAIVVKTGDALQSKAHRSYYQQTARLSQGEIYISDINLNREHNRLDYPLWSTYRVATPIFDHQGQLFGMIIINYNADALLARLESNVPANMAVFITNSRGQYLLHPFEPQLNFAFEHNKNNPTWQQQFQQLDDTTLQTVDDEQRFLFASSDIMLPGGTELDLQRQLTLTTVQPQSAINAAVAERRQSSLLVVFAIVGVGFIIILIYRKILLKQVDLSYAQSQYAAVIQGSRDAIIMVDLQGRIQDWNQSSTDILGKGQQLRDQLLIDIVGDTSDKDKLQQSLANCLRDLPVSTLTIESGAQHDSIISLSVSLSPVRGYNSEIVGASVIIRDITRESRFQQQLEQLNQSLEQKVEERTEELVEARNVALEASSMKSSFVANVSHEIRTPLNGIIGMLNLIRREPLDGKVLNYLNTASNSARTLMMLINDILDLSKIEAGRLDIEALPLNLIDNFSQVTNSMATRAMEKNVEVVLDIADIKHDVVIGDALRLRQILNNLISNAIKFTERGEIVIFAATELDASSGDVILHSSVKDSGIGIEADRLSRLFKAFSQADATTTRRFGGTGLGLSIVNNLCKLMGGQCEVDSTSGEGSTFSFQLRFKAPEQSSGIADMIDLTGYRFDLRQRSDQAIQALYKLLSLWGAEVQMNPDESSQTDIVISPLGPSPQDNASLSRIDAELDHLLERYPQQEKFMFTLGAKYSDLQQEITIDRVFKTLICPILPVELASALSALTQRPTQLPALSLGGQQQQQSYAEQLHKLKQKAILIVDDNEINQQVASGILSYYGFELFLAFNGQQALDMLNTHPQIQLLLMDCQMPVMDGFKATELIRDGYAGHSRQKIPIIAMTAGAMAGDRDACLSAGMDDYISKPISADELEAKISIWLSAIDDQKAPATGLNAPTLEQNTDNKVFWDKEASLVRLMSDQSLFIQMLEMFEEQTPQLVSKLNAAIEEQNHEQIRLGAHKLKGSAGAIGANAVLDNARQLETAAFEGDLMQIKRLYAILKASIEDMYSAIGQYKQQRA